MWWKLVPDFIWFSSFDFHNLIFIIWIKTTSTSCLKWLKQIEYEELSQSTTLYKYDMPNTGNNLLLFNTIWPNVSLHICYAFPRAYANETPSTPYWPMSIQLLICIFMKQAIAWKKFNNLIVTDSHCEINNNDNN